MHRSHRRVSFAVAAALTLSLASPAAAQADTEVTTSLRPTASARATAPVAPLTITRNPGTVPTITRLVVPSTWIHGGTNQVQAQVAVNIPPGTDWYAGMTARHTVNGKSRPITVHAWDDHPGSSILVEGAWGAGLHRIDDIRFYRASDPSVTHLTPNSVTFHLRGIVHNDFRAKFKRKGSKVTVRVRQARRFNGVRFVPLEKVVLQAQRPNGTWRKVRVMKVNRKGIAKATIKHKRPRNHRVLVRTTAKVQGVSTWGVYI